MAGRKGVSPVVAAMQRRLETDTATPEDQEKIELARRLRELQRQGETVTQAARTLGVPPANLRAFARAGVYRMVCEHLENLEQGKDKRVVERARHEGRKRFSANAPHANEFIEKCFAKGEDGAYLDSGLAQWATQLIAKGEGWDQPEASVKPAIHISIHEIKLEQEAIRGDDNKFHARDAVIEVEAQQVDA